MSNESAMGGELVGCQFSVYPLEQADYNAPIRDAIEAAAQAGATIRVQNLSTLMQGDEATVFRALQAAFTAAGGHGVTVMVATLTTGVPRDETVREIQETRVERSAGSPSPEGRSE
jgi:uncharacterized protein YqgV (UPF0045/DUF77 family)